MAGYPTRLNRQIKAPPSRGAFLCVENDNTVQNYTTDCVGLILKIDGKYAIFMI
jgi:hypothetical protein